MASEATSYQTVQAMTLEHTRANLGAMNLEASAGAHVSTTSVFVGTNYEIGMILCSFRSSKLTTSRLSVEGVGQSTSRLSVEGVGQVVYKQAFCGGCRSSSLQAGFLWRVPVK